VSCGGYESEVILGCTDRGKKLEFLDIFNLLEVDVDLHLNKRSIALNAHSEPRDN
jgi:hypothetical protein